jgi:hypothetical protein
MEGLVITKHSGLLAADMKFHFVQYVSAVQTTLFFMGPGAFTTTAAFLGLV